MTKANNTLQQLLAFNLGDDTFAVDVLKAREVLDCIDITRIPQTPPFMLGVINLRGSVVPVIDLRRKFAMPAAEKTRDTCIIVLEICHDEGTLIVGALADSVEAVLEVTPDQIEPPPRIGTRLKTDFIHGMVNYDENFVIFLDIDQIFTSEDLDLVQCVGHDAAA